MKCAAFGKYVGRVNFILQEWCEKQMRSDIDLISHNNCLGKELFQCLERFCC